MRLIPPVIFKADPKELIRLVTHHVSAYSDWPEELQRLIGQLQLYNERLTDFTQAQVLQGLGRGVDVQRFSSDSDYKKETILGLTEYVGAGLSEQKKKNASQLLSETIKL